MKVSIYDVAKKAGVSVVTVSRVLNNAPTVREKSKAKVMEAVKALNYTPSAAARSLAKGKTQVIGILLPNLSDSFLSEVVLATDLALEKLGYSLAVTIIDHNSDELKARSNFFFQQDRVDGVLVLTPMSEAEYLETLQVNGIPFVVIDNQNYPFRVPSVVVDNFKGGYEATKHLIQKGHETIAHLAGPKSLLSANERLAGYEKALEEVGLTPFGVYRGEFEIKTGFDVVKAWVEHGQMPTAVFAGDDNIAFGVIDCLRLHGYRVPEDVSVVGYDDHPFCSQLHPKLTTIRQPSADLANDAVDLLMQMMKGDQRKNMIVKRDPQLIERSSVKALV